MNASKSSAAPIIAILCLFMLCVGGLGFFLFAPEEAHQHEKSASAQNAKKDSKTVAIDGDESEISRPFKYVRRPKGTPVEKAPEKFKDVATLKSGRDTVNRTMSLGGFTKQVIPKVPAAILKKTGLRGRLLDSNKNPVPNAKVTAMGSVRSGGGMVFMGDIPGMRGAEVGSPGATTDADGRFVLMGLNYKLSYSIRLDAGKDFHATNKPAPTLRSEEVVNAGDFTIEKPGQISGYVVDPSGQPMPGATVRINDSGAEMPIIFGDDEDEVGAGVDSAVSVMVAKSSDNGEVTMYSTLTSGKKTDKEGRFTFEDLNPGKYTVTASKKGFRKAQAASIVVAESQHVQKLRLPLGIAGKIKVLVKNEAGEPVGGATVLAKPYSDLMVGSMFFGKKKSGIKTDNNGFAYLENLSQNKYRVVVSANGYGDSMNVVEFKKGEEEVSTTITMKEGARIIGRILRAKDQSAVVQAIVYVRKLETSKAKAALLLVPEMVLTDKEGRFKSKALNPGLYEVNVSADGLQPTVRRVTVTEDKKIEDLGDVSLEALQSLEVTVFDLEGKPLAGAKVRVNQASRGMVIRRSSSGSEEGEADEMDISIGGVDSEKTTNEQGVVVLKSVSPGKVSLHVTKDGQPDGFAEDVVVVEGAGLSRATVRLMEPGKIEGSIAQANGEVGAKLTVYLFRKGHRWPITSAKSDAEGNYVFSMVSPGSYLLRVNNMRPLSVGEKLIDLRSDETLREDLVAPAPKGEK